LPPGVGDAAARTLAAAFADDPTAVGVGAGPGARRLLVRVPVDAAAHDGGLLLSGDPARPSGVAAWVRGGRRSGGLGRVLGTGSWRLLPALGPRRLLRVVRDAAATDTHVARHVTADDAYLWLLGVHPGSQGHGLGRRLVQAARDDARAAGLHRLVLVTHRAQNVPVYRAMGFELLDDTVLSRGHTLHVLARKA
ncbi:GNAT family N-acetyltransferase, partial [Aquipuribacter hungaricus]